MPIHPFIPFADCAEVVCQGQMAGQAAYLTFGVKHAGAWGGTDLQDVADAVALWLSSEVAPLQQNGITWDRVKATDLTTQFSPVAISTNTLPVTGGVASAALTNQVALVVSFKTAKRGRSFRGRNYIPSIPPADLASTTSFSSAAAANFALLYVNLVATRLPAGNTFVILSRQENGVRRTTGVTEPVTNFLGRTAVGTQRRRVIGHGI